MNKDKFPRLITAKQAFDLYYESIPGISPVDSMQRVIDAVIESIDARSEAVTRASAIAAIDYVIGHNGHGRSVAIEIFVPAVPVHDIVAVGVTSKDQAMRQAMRAHNVMTSSLPIPAAIEPKDLRIDTYRAPDSGQWSTKPDQCVRVTHVPTGITVERCDDRSQHRNRANALQDLAHRLAAEPEVQETVTAAMLATPADERALSDIPSDSIDLLERAARARLADAPTVKAQPIGYIHPDNVRRLESGTTVAFRKKPYDGERQIPVYLDAPTVSATVITDSMIDAYLTDQRKTVEDADRFGRPNIGGLHTDTVRAACRAGLVAALNAAPTPPTSEADNATKGGSYHPLRNIAEWRKGCSCAEGGQPETCGPCTVGLIDAIEDWHKADSAERARYEIAGHFLNTAPAGKREHWETVSAERAWDADVVTLYRRFPATNGGES